MIYCKTCNKEISNIHRFTGKYFCNMICEMKYNKIAKKRRNPIEDFLKGFNK